MKTGRNSRLNLHVFDGLRILLEPAGCKHATKQLSGPRASPARLVYSTLLLDSDIVMQKTIRVD